MTLRLLLGGLLVAFTVAAPVRAQELQPIERIAAVVDEEVILQSELDRAVANVTVQYANQPGQLPPREVLERQVLERLILLKLQVARAAGGGVKITDTQVDDGVAAVAQQNNVTVEALRERLANDGLSFNEFRNSIRDEIAVQRLRQNFAQSRIQVSEAEVDAALAAESSSAVQYRLAHILVGLPEGATAEQIAIAEKKIVGVKALIDTSEMDFSAAAVRYSDSPNALEGGDLGWRSTDEIPRAFSELLTGVSPGTMVGPLRGPSGFQLLKLVEVRDSSLAPQKLTEYNARHILARVTALQDAAAAKAKVDTLRARIAGGADFAEVAKEASEDANSRTQGGDLGWFDSNAFGPEFGSAVTGVSDGGVSEPFRTEAGWHILQRIGMRETDGRSATQRAQVRETIGRRKLEDEYNRFLREIRGEAYVSYRNASAAPASDAK